jgi:hypothetical protein
VSLLKKPSCKLVCIRLRGSDISIDVAKSRYALVKGLLYRDESWNTLQLPQGISVVSHYQRQLHYVAGAAG